MAAPTPAPSFFDRLSARCDAVDSILCVGLDPHRQDLEALGDVSADGAFAFARVRSLDCRGEAPPEEAVLELAEAVPF